ncbi:hypothetical protein A1O7_02626, partial [Cladophialophora yegresii CBS 114405]
KRTLEACDRCRIKKTKCNGSSPCERCATDNAICVFRKVRRPRNRIVPRGYVELLEIQQQQLVRGIQKLYQYMKKETARIGAPLEETNDSRPLTHDILERLGVMEPEDLTSGHAFEADLEVLQQKLSRAG